jgi:hypothetical protein
MNKQIEQIFDMFPFFAKKGYREESTLTENGSLNTKSSRTV